MLLICANISVYILENTYRPADFFLQTWINFIPIMDK